MVKKTSEEKHDRQEKTADSNFERWARRNEQDEGASLCITFILAFVKTVPLMVKIFR